MPRTRRAENNYSDITSNPVYEEIFVYSNPTNEIGISSLDLAAFTVNRGVHKDSARSQDTDWEAGQSSFEPVTYLDAIGKGSLKSSRRLRHLVALNVILLVLTLFCLGLTSFVGYKVIFREEGCHRRILEKKDTITSDNSYSSSTEHTTDMASVNWSNVLTAIQDLQRNISALKNLTKVENNFLRVSLGEVLRNLSHLRDEVYREGQHVIWLQEQTIASLQSQQGNLTALWQKVNLSQTEISVNREVLVNISRVVPPRGPPGYNGTRGPPGSPGPSGPPGSPGTGNNVTVCSYKTRPSKGVQSNTYAKSEVTVREKQGTKIIGVHCDTNDAKTCKLTSEIQSNRRVYKCECDGSLHTGEVTMYCYLHYWECPFDM